MRFQSDKEIKRSVARNKRLFKEFPWLWAIKNHWDFGSAEISVGSSTVSVGVTRITPCLYSLARPSCCEVMWVVKQMPGMECYEVEQVKTPEEALQGKLVVAEVIWNSLSTAGCNQVVYIVHCSGERVSIFRPEKKGANFNQYLCSLARERERNLIAS